MHMKFKHEPARLKDETMKMLRRDSGSGIKVMQNSTRNNRFCRDKMSMNNRLNHRRVSQRLHVILVILATICISSKSFFVYAATATKVADSSSSSTTSVILKPIPTEASTSSSTNKKNKKIDNRKPHHDHTHDVIIEPPPLPPLFRENKDQEKKSSSNIIIKPVNPSTPSFVVHKLGLEDNGQYVQAEYTKHASGVADQEIPPNIPIFPLYGKDKKSNIEVEEVDRAPPPLESSSQGTRNTVKKEDKPPLPPHLQQSKFSSSQPIMTKTYRNKEKKNETILYYHPNPDHSGTDLPPVVYDSHGNAIPIDHVVQHTSDNGGSLVVEHPPPPPPPEPKPEPVPHHPPSPPHGHDKRDILSVLKNETHSIFYFPKHSTSSSSITSSQKRRVNPADWENMPEAQDQMIIVSTVATMALLVGALSARRLRARHFLSSCIENESLEDELAYDTAYTTSSISGGFSGRGGGSYDTFSSAGGAGGGRGLPWRGDLEKFDV